MLFVAVVADEPDVNADQKSEDQGLYETDQKFEEVEWNRQSPLEQAGHGMQQVLASEYVSEKTEGKRYGTKDDRDDFDETDDAENNEQHVIQCRRHVALVGLVAE